MPLRLPCLRIGLLALFLMAGCLHSVQEPVDQVLRDLTSQPLDIHVPATAPAQVAAPASTTAQLPNPTPIPKSSQSTSAPQASQGEKQPATKTQALEQRLKLSPNLPGATSELILPKRSAPPEEKLKAIQALYPPLPPLAPFERAQPGPTGQPMTLTELQQIAMASNPSIKQAASDVEAARGAARQAAAHPNPTVGYEADTVGSAGTAGQQGAFFTQLIKTAGKLKTAEASALMNLLNSEVALRRAQVDVMGQVRANYFAVLVARESLRWNIELAASTASVFNTYVEQTKAGLLAGYEPALLRSLAVQAQNSVVQAQNRYRSAWKQLAASIGQTDLPLTELAGHAEMAVPAYVRDAAFLRVLANHTDIFTARNSEKRARYDLRSAQLVPVPDVNLQVVVQKDYTAPPFGTTCNIQAGVPLPVWDRNLGGIQQAQANLYRATQEESRVRLDLSTRLADALERYETNRAAVAFYKSQVLPNIAMSYAGASARYLVTTTDVATPGSSYEFIAILQNYITALATYQTALASQWQAVVDVANLLQINDLYEPLPLAGPGGEVCAPKEASSALPNPVPSH